MMLKKTLSIWVLTLLLGSCATYHPQYRNPGATPSYPTDKTIEKTFYLIGDAGISPPGRMSTGLSVFQNFIKTEDTQGDYAIFLGDNIYDDGMPPLGHPERDNSERYMDMQFQSVAEFRGTTYFIPGNHDWYANGVIGLEREEQYIARNFKEDGLQPSNGCPLQSFSVSENTQLVIIDSQWYLENWNMHPTINDHCEIKTRDKLFIEIELELEKNKNKTVVFAMHHPMFTNGTHGGYFALKKHLYPTQRPIPMPILASLVAQIRSQGGVSVQDRYNELSNKLMNRLAPLAKKHGRVVFASGHEHTLQHIEEDGLVQIQSGSGAKSSYAALGSNGLFSYGGQGFAVYDVFTDGSSYVRYYGSDEQFNPVLLYEKEIFPENESYPTQTLPRTFEQEKRVAVYEPDSVNQALFFNTVWGSKYKEAYTTPVTAKVAHLDSLYGGLQVIRRTGNDEYRSLLLRDKIGNRYQMRALKKEALQYTQKIIFEDEDATGTGGTDDSNIAPKGTYGIEFYTASHPYATLAIPILAEAAAVFHNQSELYYIPKQPALGSFNNHFGDALYMLSIEPAESREGEPLFEYPDDIETTDDILTKLRAGEGVFIDEQNYITSRLFDMVVGDWDREPDHWRWAEYAVSDSLNSYVPIPRNRDDAFASFEGNVLDFARTLFGRTYQRHIYNDNFNDFRWFNEQGIILDRALLKRSGGQQWKFAAQQLQQRLSDAVIDSAFSKVPREVRNESLQQIVEKLKGRRDKLVAYAERYYQYLAKLQTIVGNNKPNYFEVTRLPYGKTNIKEYTYENNRKTALLTDRTLSARETKEIWLYGLDGNDYFEVKGTGDNPIFLRIIGGQDYDTYRLENGKATKVYDHESLPNSVELKKGGNLRLTDVYNLNAYDYRKQITKVHAQAAAFGYNPDDGFRLGAQYIYQVNSFQRNPFSRQHKLNAGYYFDTESFDVEYEGEIANVKDALNLHFGARITSPTYTVNYFGYGNETNNLEESQGFDANRVQLQTLSAQAGMLRNSNFGSFFKIQGRFEAIFLQSEVNAGLNPSSRVQKDEAKYFSTLEGIYNYRSFDNPRNPTIGMMFDLHLGATANIEDTDRLFSFLQTRLGFYNSLTQNDKWVLKTNIRAQFNFDNPFEFYQAVTLGANNGLRGYREERFSGKSALVGSADLRYSFDEFKIELVPIQVGMYVGGDLGRVWTPSGTSEKWHSDYGGGLWINGSGGLSGTVSAFRSSEDTRVIFGIGFDF